MRYLSVAALLFSFGCNNPPPAVDAPAPGALEVTGEPAIRVGDKVISQEMVDAVSERIPPQQLERMKSGPQWQQFQERIALGQLLYDEAIFRGVHEDPKVKLAIAMSSRDVLAAELLDIVATEAITDEKVQAAYDERKVQYARPQVSARHILVKEKDLADELKAQLDGGADFAKLAAEHSMDPGSKTKGGDLGWFEDGRMVKPFSDAAFAANKGDTVGPIETKFGFHIINVADKRDSIPLEEVKEQLTDTIKQEAVRAYMDELKKDATILYGDDAKNPPAKPAGGDKAEATPAAPAAPAAAGHGADDGHGH